MSSLIKPFCGKAVSVECVKNCEIRIQCESVAIVLRAVGEFGYSKSVFMFLQNTMQDIVGNVIISIDHISDEDHRDHGNNEADAMGLRLFHGKRVREDEWLDAYEYIHLYHIKLDNGHVIPIYLVNYSNGYYRGEMRISYSHINVIVNNRLNPAYFANIIVGHSGSWKTTFIHNRFDEREKGRDSVHILDDCMFCNDDFATLEVLNVPDQECHVIISDPRLCDLALFCKLICTLSNICPMENIRIIHFDNNYQQCCTNRNIAFSYLAYCTEHNKYAETLEYIKTIPLCDKIEEPVYKMMNTTVDKNMRKIKIC
jgi:hypothetical protein